MHVSQEVEDESARIWHHSMQWDEQVLAILNQVRLHDPSDAIISQFGENDLTSCKRLGPAIQVVLHALHTQFSSTLVFWSDLLDMRKWCSTHNPEKVNVARKKVTKAVDDFVIAVGGQLIQHPDILFKQEAHFRPNAVHLLD
ncbi:UNVERIFIED_CONTAM: hypothetical protein K2H54_054582 [Gekko kuhli]